MALSGVNFYEMFLNTYQQMSNTAGTSAMTNPLLQRKEMPEVQNLDNETNFQASNTDTAKKNTQEFAQEIAKENAFKTQPANRNKTYAQKLNELLKEYVENEAPRLSENDFKIIQKIVNNYIGSEELTPKNESLIKEILEKEEYWGQTAAEMQQQAEAEIEKAKQEAEAKAEKTKIESLNPEYNKETIIAEANLLNVHNNSENTKTGSYTGKDRLTNTKQALYNQASAILDSLESALIKNLGNKATEEVKSYITNTKKTILDDIADDGYMNGITHLYDTTSNNITGCSIMGNYNITTEQTASGVINKKNLIDIFFATYDTFAQNSVEEYQNAKEQA